MDAQKSRELIAVLLCLGSVQQAVHGATFSTENFLVHASSVQLAKEIGLAAESFRRDLAIEWLGYELTTWPDRCTIVAHVNSRLGAQGATTFLTGNRRAWDFSMEVWGSNERVLDSVLPHEVTHTVFATHFGRRLPRWADEGACTTVEDVSERRKHDKLLVRFLKSGRSIAFHQLFAIQEYPDDILPLYSQGYSLSRFLIEQQGKRAFVKFMERGMARGDWLRAIEVQYGYSSFTELQYTWLEWVKEGSPVLAGKRYEASSDQRIAGRSSGHNSRTRQVATRNGSIALDQRSKDGGNLAVNDRPSRAPTSVVADTDGWYSRRYSELRSVPRVHAKSHTRGKPSTSPIVDASVPTIRR
jgi:hypothetical protein